MVRIDSRGGICVEQSAAWRSSLDPITGTYQEEVKTSCRQPAELRKQVRAFREYDQKSGWCQARRPLNRTGLTIMWWSILDSRHRQGH